MDELKVLTLKSMIELLEDTDFKDIFIKELNKKIDLPFFNENTERRIYESVYVCILDALKNKNID